MAERTSRQTDSRPVLRWRGITVAAVAAVLALPAAAVAHLERPSYWPDPAPDRSVKPAAGGEVPGARGLASAVSGNGPGSVLVVCKGEDGAQSLSKLRKSLRDAQANGYRVRPSQPKYSLSEARAEKLERWNAELAQQCSYDSIQEAVFDAANNDRV